MRDLEAARGHVVFEYSMLLFATAAEASLLDSLPADSECFGSRALLGSMARDSALLHARALHCFLSRDGDKDDDVVVGDFLSETDNPTWRASLPELDRVVRDFNKFRGHITSVRSTEDWPEWDLPAVRDELQTALCEFLGLLGPRERAAWEAELARRLKWQTEPADRADAP